MTQGTVLCVSFPWLFFCSREGRSPPGWWFPLGNWLILPENSASRATQRTVPCADSLNPRQSRKDKKNNYKAAKYPMYDSKRWNSFSYAGFHIFVVPSFIVNCEEQYCKIENKVKNQHSNRDIVNYHTLILLLRDTGDGSLCLFSLAVFLFPGGPEPSRVVFFAGKSAVFAGKHGEINASRGNAENSPLCHLVIIIITAFIYRNCLLIYSLRQQNKSLVCNTNTQDNTGAGVTPGGSSALGRIRAAPT